MKYHAAVSGVRILAGRYLDLASYVNRDFSSLRILLGRPFADVLSGAGCSQEESVESSMSPAGVGRGQTLTRADQPSSRTASSAQLPIFNALASL
jgi:hypothetical protein